MGSISGLTGHIAKGAYPSGGSEAAMACTGAWGVSHTSSLPSAYCTAGEGAPIRGEGIQDWSGQFSGNGVPIIWPGDLFFFAGSITGNDTDAVGAGGPAIVDQVAITWNQETNDRLTYSLGFSGCGAMVKTGLDVPADSSTPDPLWSRGKMIQVATPAASPSYASIDEVRSATLTISRANVSAVTTAGNGWVTRAPGPLDVKLDLTLWADADDGWTLPPQPNSIQQVRLYTETVAIEGADKYFELKYMMFSDIGAMDVDTETGNFVGCSISASFAAVTRISGTSTKGSIILPTTAQWWPAVA